LTPPPSLVILAHSRSLNDSLSALLVAVSRASHAGHDSKAG